MRALAPLVLALLACDGSGIATAMNPNGQGIGFATPIDAVKDALPQLLRDGKVARGKLGVEIAAIDSSTARALGMERPKGALVTKVASGGAAQRAGLRGGDVIVRVEDRAVERSTDLARLVARHPPGTRVKVFVLRGPREEGLEITLDALD